MRAFCASLVCVILVMTATAGLLADAKLQQRTQVKFEGALGKMVGLFGGKAAKEGIVTSVAVKGNRRLSTNDTTAELVDLDAEKVYRIDMRGKSYTVQTFDEIRKQFARSEAQAQSGEASGKPDPKQPEMEIDVDVKKTGQQKSIAGYPCEQVILTLTMHEQGKTVAEAGGMVITADMWMAPKVDALHDAMAFERRYLEKLYGPDRMMPSAKDFAQAMAMYPGMKAGLARLQTEGAKMDGTPLVTTMTVAGAGSPESGKSGGDKPVVGGLPGGLGGLFGKKKAAPAETAPSGGASGVATILTTVTEVLAIGDTVAAIDVEIPAGFKQK
jgi:hypothetical protein